MNNIAKIGIVAGGAYLLYRVYESYSSPSTGTTTTPGATSGAIENTIGVSTTTPTTQTIQAGNNVPSSIVSPGDMYSYSGTTGDTLLTPDEWNYYYQQKTGKFISGDMLGMAFGDWSSPSRSQKYTYYDWVIAMQQKAGLTGLGGLQGMGILDNRRGFGVIAGEYPTGYERANKTFR